MTHERADNVPGVQGECSVGSEQAFVPGIHKVSVLIHKLSVWFYPCFPEIDIPQTPAEPTHVHSIPF